MEKEVITINIGNVADGAMVEAFEVALQKAITNIMDPNTEARTKRKIVLALTLHPKEDRCQVNVEFTVETKLAGIIPSTGRLFIGKTEDGMLVPLADDPRQMNIFTPPKPPEAPSVLTFKTVGGPQ